jgi:hypothetical protein
MIQFTANTEPATNFVKDLRDAAMACSNIEYRQELREQATALRQHIIRLEAFPSVDNMAALNGAWARATVLLKNVPPEGTPDPLSGAPEAALLAA